MSAMDFVPSQIDYTTKKTCLPKYRFNRVPLNNTSSAGVVVSANTTQLLEFKIPGNSVFNFAKTILQYTYVTEAAAHYTHCHENPEIQNIQLATASNVILCDVQNINYSNHLLNKLNTKKSDILTGSSFLNAQGLTPPAFLSNHVVCSSDNQGGDIVGSVNSVNLLATDVANYQVSADTAALTVNRAFELKHIGQDTILALDKDLYFGQDLYLRLWLTPGSKVVWSSTAFHPNNLPVVYAGVLTYSNIYLYLACESNMIIQESVKAKVATGMTLQIPFLTSYRFGVAQGSTASNVVINLNSSNGRKLKNILWSSFNAVDSINTVYDSCNASSNPAQNKITTYRTYINNQPETDFEINLALNDDYRENKDRLKGSLIGSTLKHYKYFWHHMSRYGSMDNLDDVQEYDNNMVDGVDLTVPMQYTIQMNSVAAPAQTIYAFVNTQKELTITPSLITLS